MIPEFERAVLLEDFPDHRFKAGDGGVVVHIHQQGAGYELEMMTADGHTLNVITVNAHQVRPVGHRDMLRVREIDPAASNAQFV